MLTWYFVTGNLPFSAQPTSSRDYKVSFVGNHYLNIHLMEFQFCSREIIDPKHSHE